VVLNKLLIDTNVYGAFKANDPEIVRKLRSCEEIHVNVTVLAELIAGFKAGTKEARNREELKQFLNSPRVVLDEITEATAEFYAHIYMMLRLKGSPVPPNDIWIAASAAQHGCALFSLDKHFGVIDGLLRV
jgi:tRNA(fMet)-specific endonuclease VapC